MEWVAISFSRRSSQPWDWTQVSLIVQGRFTIELPGKSTNFTNFKQTNKKKNLSSMDSKKNQVNCDKNKLLLSVYSRYL